MNRKSIMLVTLPAAFAFAPAHGQAIRKANPPTVAKPVAAYSHVAEVPPGTRLLYLAGQVGNRPDGSLPESVDDQAAQALENIRLILAAEGARLGVDFGRTWSCYKGGAKHCGKCGTCVERREAFLLAGLPDPTAYESTPPLPRGPR